MIVFILSTSFIAYAPDYIGKINDFSKDISNASLDVGTKIVMPNTDIQGKDSVDMIRDSLFSVQVKQPWLLLQYGTTDVESLGAERVESLLSTSPNTNNGEDREDIVIDEIENHDNANLSIAKTISRLGTVFIFVHLQYRYLRVCVPTYWNHGIFTGAIYYLRYVLTYQLLVKYDT